MLGAMLQELLLACCRVCAILQDVPEQIHTTDREIVRAARFITEHYAEPITAADIAAAAGFSPNYLSRKFREAAGFGVHEYLTFIRLRNAAHELTATGTPSPTSPCAAAFPTAITSRTPSKSSTAAPRGTTAAKHAERLY